MSEIVIVGGGGFGREVLDVVDAINLKCKTWTFLGFVADIAPNEDRMEALHATWLGTIDHVLKSIQPVHYVVGISSPTSRRLISQRFDAAGWQAASLIHPTATVGADVRISPGAVICSNVSITTHVNIGKHVHVNLNATIGHDCKIGDFVTVNPMVAVSGDVEIDEGATMGTHSSILQGRRVGTNSIVGAGAVVVRNVPPNSTVVGVPAKPMV